MRPPGGKYRGARGVFAGRRQWRERLTVSFAILSTVLGFLVSDYLSKDMMIGLAIVNPIYFFCMLIGSIKNIAIGTSVILGTILGPAFYLISPEWCILYGGVSAGVVAFFAGEFDE